MLALFIAIQNVAPLPVARPPGYAEVKAMEVPVVATDVLDHPYRVIAELKTDVRKWTIFEKDPSERRVYAELWERARKLGADAVVNARYGDTLYGGLTWGRRHASGQAIKFLSAAEAAAYTSRQVPMTAPAPIVTPGPRRVRANTASGFCLDVPNNYAGTGSISRPAITSAMPRCSSLGMK